LPGPWRQSVYDVSEHRRWILLRSDRNLCQRAGCYDLAAAIQLFVEYRENTYRIAFAPANSVAFTGWCYYDFNPAFFGVTNAGANFDYPDVSLSSNYVWYQTRIFSTGGFVGTLIFRIHITEAVACQNTSVDWVITDSAHFTVSLAKGAASTMYFFVHNSTSSERVYTWAEGTLSYTWNDFNVSSWTDNARQCAWPINTGGMA
jgi:hypothetical protein